MFFITVAKVFLLWFWGQQVKMRSSSTSAVLKRFFSNSQTWCLDTTKIDTLNMLTWQNLPKLICLQCFNFKPILKATFTLNSFPCVPIWYLFRFDWRSIVSLACDAQYIIYMGINYQAKGVLQQLSYSFTHIQIPFLTFLKNIVKPYKWFRWYCAYKRIWTDCETDSTIRMTPTYQ